MKITILHSLKGFASYRWMSIALIAAILGSVLLTAAPAAQASVEKPPYANKIFLPTIFHNYQVATPKMVGVIAKGYWGTTTSDIQTKLKTMDTWAGKKHSVVGWFFDMVAETGTQSGTDFNFKGQLENLWVNGYVSFVNLPANGLSARAIADGNYDANLHRLATAYAGFVSKGGGRKAFIAPLQEMNGYWVSYGNDPSGFKAAYDRIRTIFASHGIDSHEIWWTFAPNGWSEAWNGFELYYPGDAKVDVVAYSSYNYGFCPVGNAAWRKWADYTVVHKPYIERMRLMAPTKPIIIAQTASSAQSPSAGVYDAARKGTWLENTYDYLAQEHGVAAILYFDINKQAEGECDFEVYNAPHGSGPYPNNGYKTAVDNPKYQYYDPATLSQLDLMGPP